MAQIGEVGAGAWVRWRVGRGSVTGQVLRKAVCRIAVSGEEYPASPNAPRFLVRRDDTGQLVSVASAQVRPLAH